MFKKLLKKSFIFWCICLVVLTIFVIPMAYIAGPIVDGIVAFFVHFKRSFINNSNEMYEVLTSDLKSDWEDFKEDDK